RSTRSGEREIAHAKIVAARRFAPVEPAVYRGHLEQRQILGEARRDVRERHIRRGLRELAGRKRDPEAQRALAAAHVDRVIDPGAPGGEVGRAERGVHAPVPARWMLDAATLERGAHFQAGPELARRTRGE